MRRNPNVATRTSHQSRQADRVMSRTIAFTGPSVFFLGKRRHVTYYSEMFVQPHGFPRSRGNVRRTKGASLLDQPQKSSKLHFCKHPSMSETSTFDSDTAATV